jgi:hypothetical protein
MKEQVTGLPNLSQAEPLVSRLTAEQQLQLRQALVRQAIRHVTKALPPEALDAGHSLGCRWAARWLDCPTEEVARDVCTYAAGECWDGGVRYFDYPERFLAPVWVIGVTNLDAAARLAAETAPESERGAAVGWQSAAVRAIARGQEPPPE